MSAISIVLKAVDQYSSTLVGLNASFELVSKAVNLVGSAANSAFEAINKGVQLAAQGGQYAEIRRQFNNVAENFQRDGSRILDDLDRITLGTLDLAKSASLAGKGVAAGLSEPQLATAFEFVKRRTELTGESFEGLSQQVFNAISSGRTSVLRQMGLVVEAGASVEDVMNELSRATANYGDSGFNAADKIAALSQAQTRFTTALGVAINETPLFQDALSFVSDSIFELVRAFDPRPITEFFQAFGKVVVSLVNSVSRSLPALSSVFGASFEDVTDTVSSAGRGIADVLFSIIKSVSSTVNNVLDILSNSGIVTIVEFIAQGLIEASRQTSLVVVTVIGWLVENVAKGFSEIAGLIGDVLRDFPLISQQLGLDPGTFATIENNLKRSARGVSDFSMSLLDGIDAAADFGSNVTAGVADFARNFRIDETDIDNIRNEFSDAISNIDYGKTWGDALSDSAARPFGNFGALAGENVLREASRVLDGLPEAAKNAGKETGAELAKSATSEWLNAAKFDLSKIGVQDFLQLDLFDQVTAKQFMDSEERRIRDRMRFEFDLRRQERESIAQLQQKTDPLARLMAFAANINWPAETENIMRFFLMWLAQMAADEPVPLAITTGV